MTEYRDMVETAFRRDERALWGLCYRMTGNAADADELVQSTFARAIERPPVDTTRPLRPWLRTIAMNLSRDALRRRRARPYDGPWLPSPLEDAPDADVSPTAETRYERMESVTLAFLAALEELSPKQRAVLILRDVYGASVEETADTLGITVADAKVSHHRARRTMEAYDQRRAIPSPDLRQRAERATARLFTALAAGDLEGVVAVLSHDVRTTNDAGGEYHAARKPLVGADRVARFYIGLVRKLGVDGVTWRMTEVNGLPALAAERSTDSLPPGIAPRFVVQVEVDDDDLIREIRVVLASDKLARVSFGERPSD